MLNPFPSLLTYSFFAPTLLRVAAALVFAYIAYRHYQNRDAISRVHFPVVGHGMWIPWAAVIVEVITALGLFFGYHTQYMAILGAIIALKHIIWRGHYPAFFWLTRSAAFLLLVICLSLLISGAGALAQDLPL